MPKIMKDEDKLFERVFPHHVKQKIKLRSQQQELTKQINEILPQIDKWIEECDREIHNCTIIMALSLLAPVIMVIISIIMM